MARGGGADIADHKTDMKSEHTKGERFNDKGQRTANAAPHNVATPSRGRRDRDAARGPASQLEDLVRRRGVEEAWNALEDMQRQGIMTDKFTVSRMLMKTVGDSRCRLNPARVYRGIGLVEKFIEMQPKDVDEVLFNALLDTCCRLKDLTRLEATVQRMRDLKVKPSPVTLGILVKTYGQAGDLQKVLQVWSEMETQRDQANAVTYGCMIDACVKCGNLEKAVEIFDGMKAKGKHKNTILYTTLIKGYGLEKDLNSAIDLFREMLVEDVPYNTITYNSIIDACIKCGDLQKAEQLLREMTLPESKLDPDLITFSTLLKGYCHVGDIDKALRVAEAIKERGLRKDELVYNTLMDGCVKANDITAGVGLFEEMVQQQMRPSAITHSILVRLYQRAGYEDDATEAVAQLYQHHGIERPSGGDRGKGLTKKGWISKSPCSANGRGNHSPMASPMSSQQFQGHRDRSDSSWTLGSWNDSHGLPALPSYDQSGASTPMGGHMQGNGLCLPMEAMRQCQVQMHGAYAASPTGCEQNMNAFGMPPSPCMQPVGSPMACMQPMGSPMACMAQAHGQPMQNMQWQYPNGGNGGQFCGMQMQNGMVACTPNQMPMSNMNGDGSMQFNMMQQCQQMPQQMPQQCQQMQVPVNMQQNSFGMAPAAIMQSAPFPMPLSPPHDLAHSSFPLGTQPAYFENWTSDGQQQSAAAGMQLVSVPVGNACPQ